MLAGARKTLAYWKRLAQYRDRAFVDLIQPNPAWVVEPVRIVAGGVEIAAFGQTARLPEEAFLVRGMRFWQRLHQGGFRTRRLADGRLLFERGGVRVVPNGVLELLTLCEVFLDGMYGFEIGEPGLVWDIGANVGASALYFASQGWDVWGFELFPPTAEAALENVGLSETKGAIEIEAKGLGPRDETLELPYNDEFRAANGLYGNFALDAQGAERRVRVEVADAAPIAEAVLSKAAGRRTLIKLDCEGAEYPILQRLEETRILGRFDVVLMEVHAQGGQDPHEAVERLVRSGFAVAWPGHVNEGVAMAAAVKLP